LTNGGIDSAKREESTSDVASETQEMVIFSWEGAEARFRCGNKTVEHSERGKKACGHPTKEEIHSLMNER